MSFNLKIEFKHYYRQVSAQSLTVYKNYNPKSDLTSRTHKKGVFFPLHIINRKYYFRG